MAWRTSQLGIDLIKEFEGLRLTAYQDGVGVWTIGYGHTGGIRQGDAITEHDAEVLLGDDVAFAERAVNELVHVPLKQSEFDALVSFVFNLGRERLAQSTLLRLLNEGDYVAAAEEFPRWVHAGGVVLPGLVKRREAERTLFMTEEPRESSQAVSPPIPAPVEPAPSASPSTGAAAQEPAAPAPRETVYGVAVEQPPAPVEERGFEYKEKPPVAPFIAAAIPALAQAIPDILHLFGGTTDVSDRNIKVAEKVVQVVQQATGTQNAQAAVEKVQADPQAASAARDAVRAQWYDILQVTEIGKGGIAGARSFAAANVNTRYGRVLEVVTYCAIGLLVLANAGVWVAWLLLANKQSPDAQLLLNLGSMIIQADIASAFTAFGFWLGSSVTKQRVPETPTP